MLSRRGLYNSICILSVCLSIGCHAQNKKDVYQKIPLGTSLTKEILKSSNQIVPNGKELILVLNISEQWDYFDPHLLFFNDSLKLYAACYFPSDKIESVKDNTITGYLNSKRNLRRHQYKNDLPEKYRLKLLGKYSGHGRKSDKLIKRIELDSGGKTTTIYIQKSDNPYIGVRGSKLLADSSFLENFTSTDTLQFSLSKLSIRYKENTVSVSEITPNNGIKWDYMLVSDQSLLDDFYQDLINYLR